MMLNYDKWEEAAERAISERFGIGYPWAPIIKNVDQSMVPIEVFNFFPAGSAIWKRYGIQGDEQYNRLAPLDPAYGKAVMIDEFYRFIRKNGEQ
jgi:hypothetical protein